MVRLLAEQYDTKSSIKVGGFWSQLQASYMSSHTEELWYNETVCLWMTLYIYIYIYNLTNFYKLIFFQIKSSRKFNLVKRYRIRTDIIWYFLIPNFKPLKPSNKMYKLFKNNYTTNEPFFFLSWLQNFDGVHFANKEKLIISILIV